MVQDSQNGLFAKSLPRQRVLSAWIPGLLTLKIQGSVPPQPRQLEAMENLMDCLAGWKKFEGTVYCNVAIN